MFKLFKKFPVLAFDQTKALPHWAQTFIINVLCGVAGLLIGLMVSRFILAEFWPEIFVARQVEIRVVDSIGQIEFKCARSDYDPHTNSWEINCKYPRTTFK